MCNDDWYRNSDWNEEIASNFEARLRKSRGNFYKAQYLRIQATYLIKTSKQELQDIGIQLMERTIREYPNEKSETICAHEQLGDYYLTCELTNKAEKHFRIVTKYYDSDNRSNTSGIADLKLCKTILDSEQVEKYNEAYQIASFNFKQNGGTLFLNSDKFFYADLMANLCFRMERKEEAVEFAKIALEMCNTNEPQFNRHKTVGIIKTTEHQLERLIKIANQ